MQFTVQCFSFVAEPQYSPDTGQIALSAEQIARDHVILHKVIQAYPCFGKSVVVGPDIVAVVPDPEGMKIIQM